LVSADNYFATKKTKKSAIKKRIPEVKEPPRGSLMKDCGNVKESHSLSREANSRARDDRDEPIFNQYPEKDGIFIVQ